MEALWDGSIDDWTEDRVTRTERGRPRRRPAPAESDISVVTTSSTSLTDFPVEVVRSPRRRKSVSARVEGGRVVVRMPQWMSAEQESEYVTSLVAKLERQRTATTVDLATRAAELGVRYGLPRPASIRWVTNQSQRWGSCTPSTGEIRISDRIAGFPGWVLDAVIVHELAHLVHLHHSPEFWALANRYPKAERAYGFLIAKQMADDEIDLG